MTVKINEFRGMDPVHVTKLRDAKIENADDLLKVWGDEAKRPGLLQSTGIGEEFFLKYVGMARLSRVKGMALSHVNVLVDADIDGPKKLFTYTPEGLMKHLGDVVAKKGLTLPVPTLKEVGVWFVDAKPELVGTK